MSGDSNQRRTTWINKFARANGIESSLVQVHIGVVALRVEGRLNSWHGCFTRLSRTCRSDNRIRVRRRVFSEEIHCRRLSLCGPVVLSLSLTTGSFVCSIHSSNYHFQKWSFAAFEWGRWVLKTLTRIESGIGYVPALKRLCNILKEYITDVK